MSGRAEIEGAAVGRQRFGAVHLVTRKPVLRWATCYSDDQREEESPGFDQRSACEGTRFLHCILPHLASVETTTSWSTDQGLVWSLDQAHSCPAGRYVVVELLV